MAPEHGGRRLQAARQHGIPPADWLDLSTGINPRPWPVPALPAELWQRLPEADDGLADHACAYYGCQHALPVAGSQAAIAALPRLRPPGRVGVLSPGYREHAHCWAREGHDVLPLAAGDIAAALPGLDTLVVINPGNPGGERFSPATLLAWHQTLSRRGGWMVVDEAFADTIAGISLAALPPRPGLVVLRSLGKFFGLAGLRVGFVIAAPGLLQALSHRLGPWDLATPSRHVAALALQDTRWQAQARAWLPAQAATLDALLARHGLAAGGACPLFRLVSHPQARQVASALARQGILVRHFDTPPALRFGLPADEAQLARLARALSSPAAA